MKWISVKDRLPEKETVVLLFTKDDEILIGELVIHEKYSIAAHVKGGRYKKYYPEEIIEERKYFYIYDTSDNRCCRSDAVTYEINEVTHWMPLPEKPD